MTFLAAALVAAIVLAIGSIRSIRWQALVYSLPVPITIVIVSTGTRVDGGQLLGVVLLNVFLAVVAFLYARFGWPILLADIVGVASYVVLAWLLATVGPVPFLPILIAVGTLWLLALAFVRPAGEAAAADAIPPRQWYARTGVVVGAALLVVAVARLINGLAVTFPYSGVLVVIETRRHLSAFVRHFARNSITLITFFTAYWALQDRGEVLSLAAAWLAFAVTAASLHGPRWLSRRAATPADHDTGRHGHRPGDS
jgi:hypothetical protein